MCRLSYNDSSLVAGWPTRPCPSWRWRGAGRGAARGRRGAHISGPRMHQVFRYVLRALARRVRRLAWSGCTSWLRARARARTRLLAAAHDLLRPLGRRHDLWAVGAGRGRALALWNEGIAIKSTARARAAAHVSHEPPEASRDSKRARTHTMHACTQPPRARVTQAHIQPRAPRQTRRGRRARRR